jgi:hypothetical protein
VLVHAYVWNSKAKRTNTHSFSHTHTRSPTYSLTHLQTHTRSPTHSLTHSLTHKHTLTNQGSSTLRLACLFTTGAPVPACTVTTVRPSDVVVMCVSTMRSSRVECVSSSLCVYSSRCMYEWCIWSDWILLHIQTHTQIHTLSHSHTHTTTPKTTSPHLLTYTHIHNIHTYMYTYI